nr:MAG TPA: hypothetical protein [Caudoviricetes sp.]
MLLKDLMRVIFENKVTIYKECDNGYLKLYSGAPDDLPSELMGETVRVVSAKGKNHLDVDVWDR